MLCLRHKDPSSETYVQYPFDAENAISCRYRRVRASQNKSLCNDVGSGTLGGTVAEASLVVTERPAPPTKSLSIADKSFARVGAHAWKRIDGRRAARFHSTSEPERRDRAEVVTARGPTKRGRRRGASRPGNATCY